MSYLSKVLLLKLIKFTINLCFILCLSIIKRLANCFREYCFLLSVPFFPDDIFHCELYFYHTSGKTAQNLKIKNFLCSG